MKRKDEEKVANLSVKTTIFMLNVIFIVGVIALRHLPTLLNVDVDVSGRKKSPHFDSRDFSPPKATPVLRIDP